MRREPGDALVLFNGRDGEFEARDRGARQAQGGARGHASCGGAQDKVPDLWLCFAPLKKDAIDFLVEKATELGVAAFQPVITRRTVASRVNIERLRANAIEAAEQSERLTMPEVRAPISFEALVSSWPNRAGISSCAPKQGPRCRSPMR